MTLTRSESYKCITIFHTLALNDDDVDIIVIIIIIIIIIIPHIIREVLQSET